MRFIFGVGEAGAFPSMARAIYSWVPVKEGGLVHAINFSGGRLGAAIALPVVAWLIELTSWRMSFVILGVIGVVWAVIWYWWFRDDPEDHNAMTQQELEIIKSNLSPESKSNS